MDTITIIELFYVLFLCVLHQLISSFYKRDGKSVDFKETSSTYIVKQNDRYYSIASNICLIGLAIAAIAIIGNLSGVSSFSNLPIVLSMILATVGIAFMLWIGRWQIFVSDNKFQIHRILRHSVILDLTEIDKAEKKENGTILLFYKGQKIISVPRRSDNYDLFQEAMKPLLS